MSNLLHFAQFIFIGSGVVFFLIGTVGLLRFPDVYTRIHALTKADNLGLGLIMIGLLPSATSIPQALKIVLCWLLVLAASSVSAFLIANKLQTEEAEE